MSERRPGVLLVHGLDHDRVRRLHDGHACRSRPRRARDAYRAALPGHRHRNPHRQLRREEKNVKVPWPIRSVIAGTAGTAALSLAYVVERKLRPRHQGPLDYDDSLVPGQIVASIMHLPHVTAPRGPGSRLATPVELRLGVRPVARASPPAVWRALGEPDLLQHADDRDLDAVPRARPHTAAVPLAARREGDLPPHPCRLRGRRRRGGRSGSPPLVHLIGVMLEAGRLLVSR